MISGANTLMVIFYTSTGTAGMNADKVLRVMGHVLTVVVECAADLVVIGTPTVVAMSLPLAEWECQVGIHVLRILLSWSEPLWHSPHLARGLESEQNEMTRDSCDCSSQSSKCNLITRKCVCAHVVQSLCN